MGGFCCQRGCSLLCQRRKEKKKKGRGSHLAVVNLPCPTFPSSSVTGTQWMAPQDSFHLDNLRVPFPELRQEVEASVRLDKDDLAREGDLVGTFRRADRLGKGEVKRPAAEDEAVADWVAGVDGGESWRE